MNQETNEDKERDYVIECDLFHALTKKFKREDVDGIFCAIQAAMAYDCKYVDVGSLVGKIMPRGRKTSDCYCSNIGPVGLAFFHFLFEIKLEKAMGTDYHNYIFKRRFFPKTIEAYMKTSCDPESAIFQKAYNDQVIKLELERQKILDKNIYLSSGQTIMNS